MNDQIIETTVDQFVNDKKGFTSVDIGNAIKIAGTWVPNREVAAWLRKWDAPADYGVSKVTVTTADGNTVKAGVYLPNTLSVADYTTTSQEAMTPDDFQTLHGIDPLAVTVVVDPVVTPAKDYDTSTAPKKDQSVGDQLRTMFRWPKTSK